MKNVKIIKQTNQYRQIHIWIRRNKIKTKLCEVCNEKPPYDAANISGEYKKDLSDWEWLCRSCHMKKDGRLNKLHTENRPKGSDFSNYKGGEYRNNCVDCNKKIARASTRCMKCAVKIRIKTRRENKRCTEEKE